MKMNKWSVLSVCCAVGSAVFEVLKAVASAKNEEEQLDLKIRSVMQEETRKDNEKG